MSHREASVSVRPLDQKAKADLTDGDAVALDRPRVKDLCGSD